MSEVVVKTYFEENTDTKAVNSLQYLDRHFKVIEEPVEFRGVIYDRKVVHNITKEAYLVTSDGQVVWTDKDFKVLRRPSYDRGRRRFGDYANKVFSYIVVAYAYNYKSDLIRGLKGTNKYKVIVVNHKDYNKDNNDPSNLEFCTVSENTIHSNLLMKLYQEGLIVRDAKLSAIGLYKGLINSYSGDYEALLKHLVQIGNIDIKDTILK